MRNCFLLSLTQKVKDKQWEYNFCIEHQSIEDFCHHPHCQIKATFNLQKQNRILNNLEKNIHTCTNIANIDRNINI